MRVVFLTAILTHYRLPFHERVRELLGREGIVYDLVYGQPDAREAAKADTAALPWAVPVRNRYLRLGSGSLTWQPALRHLKGADLVVVGQENKLLLNYLLKSLPAGFRPRVALFGHGRNFQSRKADGVAERWKRFWAVRADWWFGYTEETKRHLAGLGFPPDRITVVNNSVDTAGLREDLSSVTPEGLERRRRELGLAGDNVAVFVGGLYSDKRIDFLIDAADRVCARIPDFELIVAGAGPDEAEVRAAASDRDWIKPVGPRFGRDKAELLALAKLFLMPGLVGLAVLDAGIAGLPVVTTGYPWHSPEIAYLRQGVNGVRIEPWEDVGAYADAVAGLLLDEDRLVAMGEAAREAAAAYTVEAMAERFADGVKSALAKGGEKF